MRRALLLLLAASQGCGSNPAQAQSPASGECSAAKPEWIWCDDFEVDRTASYFEASSQSGSFVRAEAVGLNGSFGMRTRFKAGQVEAGSLHLAFGKTPQAAFRSAAGGNSVYREIWWRVWLRLEPGWTGGGGNKLTRAIVFSSRDTWAEAAIAHVWSGNPDGLYLVLDPASGVGPGGVVVTTKYNDFDHFRWLGLARSASQVFGATAGGVWRCIEAHARLNDPGATNGVFELWIDGHIEASRVGLDWVGTYSEYGWNAVFLENYWNLGSPRAQERYFDNFVVSTRPIGCGPS